MLGHCRLVSHLVVRAPTNKSQFKKIVSSHGHVRRNSGTDYRPPTLLRPSGRCQFKFRPHYHSVQLASYLSFRPDIQRKFNQDDKMCLRFWFKHLMWAFNISAITFRKQSIFDVLGNRPTHSFAPFRTAAVVCIVACTSLHECLWRITVPLETARCIEIRSTRFNTFLEKCVNT